MHQPIGTLPRHDILCEVVANAGNSVDLRTMTNIRFDTQ